MRQKIVLLLVISAALSMDSFAQKINENIEQRAKDPKTAENAAKADVYIVKDKSAIDSLQANTTTSPADRKKAKKGKKSCKKKRNR